MHLIVINRNDEQLEFTVDSEDSRGGLTVTQVSDNHVQWEPEMLAELQRFHKYHPQINKCFRELYAREEPVDSNDTEGTTVSTKVNSKENEYSGATTYPFSAKAYQPEQTCSLVNDI